MDSIVAPVLRFAITDRTATEPLRNKAGNVFQYCTRTNDYSLARLGANAFVPMDPNSKFPAASRFIVLVFFFTTCVLPLLTCLALVFTYGRALLGSGGRKAVLATLAAGGHVAEVVGGFASMDVFLLAVVITMWE